MPVAIFKDITLRVNNKRIPPGVAVDVSMETIREYDKYVVEILSGVPAVPADVPPTVPPDVPPVVPPDDNPPSADEPPDDDVPAVPADVPPVVTPPQSSSRGRRN